MLKKRKTGFALLSLLALICSICFSGCGNNTAAENSTTVTPATDTVAVTATPTPLPEYEPTPVPEGIDPNSIGTTEAAGYMADFEDGNYGYIMMDTALSTYDNSELSIVDFNGNKWIKIDTQGGVPRVGIDVASLAGDQIENVRSIELKLMTEYEDGSFHSTSGFLYVGVLQDDAAAQVAGEWSVYVKKGNPKVVSYELAENESMVSGMKNIAILTLETDTGLEGDTPLNADMYIDNIILRDADGNAIPVDTTVSFDRPNGFGSLDWSNNVKKPIGETELVELAGTTGTSWWPVTGITFDPSVTDYTYYDPALFAPGTVITIYYEMEYSDWQRMGLTFQHWTAVNDVATEAVDWPVGTGMNGCVDWDGANGRIYLMDNNTSINESMNIAQFYVDDIIGALGADWAKDVQFFGVNDQGMEVEIKKVTIGKAAAASTEIIMTPSADSTGSSSGWGQASKYGTLKNDGGTFDIANLVPGSVIVVNYTASNVDAEQVAPLELIFQSWSGGEGWAKVSPSSFTETEATFTYEDIIAVYGSDFTTLDNINVGDCNSSLTVNQVSILVPGGSATTLTMTGGSGSSSGWGQAAIYGTIKNDGGTLDTALFTEGCMVVVNYTASDIDAEQVAPLELIFQSWSGGEGWAKVSPSSFNETEATFDYADIVAVYGSDFTTLDAMNVGDCNSSLTVQQVQIIN